MTTNKIIIGFTGLLASGKGTAAKYLGERYRASTYRFSSILRDICRRAHLAQTRDNFVKMSECLRDTFGEDLLSKAIAKDAETDDNPIVVVDGIRRIADIEHLQKLPNFVLTEISADPKIRFERLVKRGENADDNTKTFAQFLADHERSTEISILDVIPLANERINNDGSIEELHRQLDELINKFTRLN